jgi:hypothetical protein
MTTKKTETITEGAVEPLLEHTGQLITDVLPVKLQLVEDGSKSGKIVVRGEFGKANAATENKRYYPDKILMREFKRLSDGLQNRMVYGELDHPTDGRTSLNRTSHIITGLHLEDSGKVIGEAEVLDTERGRNLAALLKAGCTVGVSSRGYGSTKPNDVGEDVVQDDYRLVTYDFVAEPADTKALPKAFFESIENQKKPDEVKLREEFAAQMVEAVAQMKAEVHEQVRNEMLKDPEVAEAKGILEAVKALVRPHILSESTDGEVSKLKKTIAERDAKIAELEKEMGQLAEAAREVGYKYFLEQQLNNDPDADFLRSVVGDVKLYNKADDIKAKLESTRAEMKKQREEQEALEAKIRAEATKLSEEKDAEIAKMKAETAKAKEKAVKLEEALTESLESQKALALKRYGDKKLLNNPNAAKIRGLVEAASSKEQIDEIVESVVREPARDPDDLEALRARIRAKTKGGISNTPLDEEKPSPKARRIQEAVSTDFNNLGVSVEQLQKLSGIK